MVMTKWLVIIGVGAATSATTNSTAPRLLQSTDTPPTAETHKENYVGAKCTYLLNNKLVEFSCKTKDTPGTFFALPLPFYTRVPPCNALYNPPYKPVVKSLMQYQMKKTYLSQNI